MAFDFQKHYAPDIEQLLRQYYQSLSEKDRRRFAAVEALTLGHGGPHTLRTSWDAILTPSKKASESSSNCPMILRASVSAKQEADARRRKPNTRN